MPLTHKQALLLLPLCPILWSTAGVVSRLLQSAQGIEISFWRSFFTAVSLMIILSFMQGKAFWRNVFNGGLLLWASGVCWALMFSAFMIALTLTSVANVLITIAAAPPLTALLARFFLKKRLAKRMIVSIFLVACGIFWMFWFDLQNGISLAGALVAMISQLASATNLTLLAYQSSRTTTNEKVGGKTEKTDKKQIDMLPAVFIGASLSAFFSLPFALPFHANFWDISWLAGLGFFQLALPCLLLIYLARQLPSPQVALINQQEIIFGIFWVWLFMDEVPSKHTLEGGIVVIIALLINPLFTLYKEQRKNGSQKRLANKTAGL